MPKNTKASLEDLLGLTEEMVVDAAWMLLSCCSIAPWSLYTFSVFDVADGGFVRLLVVLAAVVLALGPPGWFVFHEAVAAAASTLV